MERDEAGWHLFISLRGLREASICNDKEVILARVMPELRHWIEDTLRIADLDPTNNRRFSLGFTRRREDSQIIWEHGA